jgi:5-carboxymethyl-2-hydroxymuconic-semialdehyde dehydrogenase
MLLAEIAHEAGLPAGVLNVVQGTRRDAGKALTEHPAIKAVAFVGESRTGQPDHAQGAARLKRVHFELGGKNPVIVFDDADLDRALDAVVFMIYSLNGERCTSSSRLLVQESIADGLHRRSWRARRKPQGRASARPGHRGRSARAPRHYEKVLSVLRHRARRTARRSPPAAGQAGRAR